VTEFSVLEVLHVRWVSWSFNRELCTENGFCIIISATISSADFKGGLLDAYGVRV
jgi:hypothetical protein